MKYSYSLDNESFHGKYDSPQEAAYNGFLELLEDYYENSFEVWNELGGELGSIYVGENRGPDLSCPIEGEEVIEKLFHYREDFMIQQAENFNPTEKQKNNLTQRLFAAWSDWIVENEIDAGFYIVENVKPYVLEFSGKELSDCGVFNFIEKDSQK